ncbi:MAG TPA: hypothetical protein VGZ25_09735 [Gemmataceae bacterium]|nr:hypothetical protein [Gemmataceae bacterium]
MRDRNLRCSRRKFLASAAALTLTGDMTPANKTPAPPSVSRETQAKPRQTGRVPIAVIATVYRPLSDAYHLMGRFLHGYGRNGQHHVPKQYVASLYVDQTPDNDLSREISLQHDIRLTRTIAEALTLDTDGLAVDGVLLIGEHGNYPRNDRGQILYPRFEMSEQITSVFRKSGKSVPVFHHKHLSHNWNKAKQMVDWSTELNYPLMAGSYLPVTWRRPELELPLNAPIKEAVVAGYGPLEVYGFYALEALQTMLERRTGGESGVKAITCLTGKEVWKAGDAGLWSWGLLEAALARSETVNIGDIRKNVGSLAIPGMPATPPAAVLVDYCDGTRGTVLQLNGHVQDFCIALQLEDQARPASCLFQVPPLPGARAFDCLAAQIEKMFETGKSPYPLQRALLTTGMLESVMESHHRRGLRVETPNLEIAYQVSPETSFVRGPLTPST